MNLQGKIVIHERYGNGCIVEVTDSYFIVKFQIEKKKFAYPDSFRKYLKFIDLTDCEKIKSDLEIKDKKDGDKPPKTKDREKKIKEKDPINIAFKCNYCDGGATSKNIGYKGVCSNNLINYNINVLQRVWCSAKESSCMKYLSGEISRQELDNCMKEEGYVCYESQMLRDWRAFAGEFHSGEKEGMPKKIKKVKNNSLAVLTTRNPHQDECSRVIFAVFLVNVKYEGDEEDSGYVGTTSKFKLSLSPEEATGFLFWNYHANKNKPESAFWGSGLFRYFDDLQAANILKDLVEIKKGTQDAELSKEFYDYFCKTHRINPAELIQASGALSLV